MAEQKKVKEVSSQEQGSVPGMEVESRFRFVHVAARRARQLMSGAQPLINTTSRKPTRIAFDEVLAGLIQYEAVPLPSTKKVPEA